MCQTELTWASVVLRWHVLPANEEHSPARITLPAPQTRHWTAWSLREQKPKTRGLNRVFIDHTSYSTRNFGCTGHSLKRRALGRNNEFSRCVIALSTLPDVKICRDSHRTLLLWIEREGTACEHWRLMKHPPWAHRHSLAKAYVS